MTARARILALLAAVLLAWGAWSASRPLPSPPPPLDAPPPPDAPPAPPRYAMPAYPGADAEYRIWGYDLLSLPGEGIELSTKVEHVGVRFVHPDAKGREVSFRLPSWSFPFGSDIEVPEQELGTGTTRDEGIARIDPRVARSYPMQDPWQPEEGFHCVVVRERSDPDASAASLLVCVATADRPIVLCDIDNTISRTEGIDLDLDFEPIAGAPEGLTRIASRALVVYLTARDDAYTNRTRAWLERHRFPLGPVLFWDLGDDTPLHHGTYKARELARLKERFPNLVAGLGNRPLDAQAYNAHGIEPFLIGPPGGVVEGYRTGPWSEVPDSVLSALDRWEARSANARAAPAR